MDRRRLLLSTAVLSTIPLLIAHGQSTKKLWFLGDSLTLGWGADNYESTWASQLGGTNLAISGSLCEEQVRCSLPYIPLWASRSDTIIWLTGYNDTDVDAYRDSFYKGMGLLLGYSVLVIGCPKHHYRDVQLFNDVAATMPWYVKCPDFERMDGDHFSQRGHDDMADFVRKSLIKPYSVYLPEINR